MPAIRGPIVFNSISPTFPGCLSGPSTIRLFASQPLSSGSFSLGPSDDPRLQGSHVLDKTKTLSADGVSGLNRKIDGILKDPGAEVVIVVLPTLTSDSLTARQHAIQLFNTWEIGKASKLDGVLIFVLTQDRKVEVVVGDRIRGTLTDDAVGRMLDDRIVPCFKIRAYNAGLSQSLDEIKSILSAGPSLVSSSNRRQSYNGSKAKSGDGTLWKAVLYLLSSLGVIVLSGKELKRRGEIPSSITCPSCNNGTMMSESAHGVDETSLENEQQQTEASLRSVKFVEYRCSKCGNTQTKRYALADSGFEECPTCHWQTARVLSTQDLAPSGETRTSDGTKKVTKVEKTVKCEHCQNTAKIINEKEETVRTKYRYTAAAHTGGRSSSGSSSSSSSGGGFSSGGGSGRSF